MFDWHYVRDKDWLSDNYRFPRENRKPICKFKFPMKVTADIEKTDCKKCLLKYIIENMKKEKVK